MKSQIDWNEIIPLLRKDLRETLMLEAVILLTANRESEAGSGSAPARRRGNGKSLRYWGVRGDGAHLAHISRIYIIHKQKNGLRTDSLMGKLWTKLIESKADTITYPGIASLCKGIAGLEGKQSAAVSYLWSHHLIEVSQKRVAIAE